MRGPETPYFPEIPQQKFDAVIVLGENIKKGWGSKEIRKDRYHLSPYSKANALAAAILFLKSATDTFIFPTGYTSGTNVSSEAEAMYAYFESNLHPILRAQTENPLLQKHLNLLKLPTYMLETKSLTTSGNAREVKKITKANNLTNLGLLTSDFHLQRADHHFRKYGINTKLIAAQQILEQVLPGIKDKFINPVMLDQELNRERLITIIETLPLGTLLTGTLARVTRK